ncbi:carotenoid biosynthesis protein [Pseudofrankia sp. BMG5.36]|uniref:carotenoid biosynthesis protein n=1 Tax=Pseudofrankia sp. BMG5.36 TaxID=1834512 RepID=UPI0008D94B39|nr:carotenoid biosynthesis protein [Pseudofrankia sp. BMG5.36]OHV61385.1 hypothetical protein BCD48_39830 [Pseudofrankia sp. BMG5.36]
MPWLAAALVVAVQIPYPLLPAGGSGRRWLTAGQVVAFFVASASHAALRRGWAFTSGCLGLTIGLGFAAEVVGVHTGWPFGRYSYTGRLGPKIVGVPPLILLAWAMMTYPALLLARWLTDRPANAPRTHCLDAFTVSGIPDDRQRWTTRPPSARDQASGRTSGRWRRATMTAIAGGVLLAGWDLFLDPRMVAEGFWRWAPGGGPTLNGIPLTNAAGWLGVGTVLVALLDRLPDATYRPAPKHGRWPAGDGVPLVLLCWTYGSWVLACLIFFGQPMVALAGGVGMALPLLPAAARAVRRRLTNRPIPARSTERRTPPRDLTDASAGTGPSAPPRKHR